MSLYTYVVLHPSPIHSIKKSRSSRFLHKLVAVQLPKKFPPSNVDPELPHSVYSDHPPFLVLSYINSPSPHHLPNFHCNIILSCTSRPPKFFLAFRFPIKTYYAFLVSPYMLQVLSLSFFLIEYVSLSL